SNMVVAHGQTNCLQIGLNAQGDENGLAWSLNFEPSLLILVSASLVNYATNAAHAFVNTNKISQGQIGFIFLLEAGSAFPGGTQAVAEICFQAAGGSDPVSTSVTMADRPIPREIDDADANSLETTYQNGTVTISGALSFQSITMPDGGH